MLKRSKVLVMLLVVTVLCASIGFAAVSDTLNVDGDIVLPKLEDNAFDGYISFTGTPTVSGAQGTDTATASVNDDTLTVSIKDGAFTARNQTITVTAEITSTYIGTVNLSADTTPTFSTNLDNYIDVTTSFSSSSITSNDGTATSSTLTVTIKVTELPLEAISNGTFDIDITAKTPTT